MSKPRDPAARMGVYKRIEDVPDHYLLERFEAEYAATDTFAVFLTAKGYDQPSNDRAARDLTAVYTEWIEHMDEQGRHHALARPKDVETFFAGLLDRMKPRSAYWPYWVRLEGFYEWLMWHTEHEHRYNPVRMAANAGGAAAEVWEAKLDS